MAQREQFFQKASELLSDSYELISEIGYGGMGLVYKAREISSESIVAIKAIRPEHTYNDTMLKRFEKEVLLTQKVDSRHVVEIKNYLVIEGFHFIVMEYLEGESLAQIIRNIGSPGVKESVAIALQILEGLKAAHDKSVIHRDLKPHNIVVDSQGAAVITDFGLAREVDSTRLTATSGLMGTPQYIAPEQWLGENPDLRTDIYSFGIMLYEMVYGLLPFQSSKDYGYMDLHLNKPVKLPGKVDGRKIPGYLRGIILKCLEKKPSQRYQSVQQIIDDLEKQRATGSFKTRIKSRLKRTSKALVVSVLLLMALIAGAYFTESYIEEKTKPVPAKPTKPLTFAVLYFEDKTNDPELEFLSYGIPDLLTTDLQQSKYLYVLPHKFIYENLRDKGYLEKFNLNSKEIVDIAYTAGVNYIIAGDVRKIDGYIKTTIRIFDGQTGSEIFVIKENVDEAHLLLTMIDRLTSKIKKIGISPEQIKDDEDKLIGDISSYNIGAIKHFVNARVLYHEGKYKKSNIELYKALNIEHNFARCYELLIMNSSFLGIKDIKNYYIMIEKSDYLSRKEYLLQKSIHTLSILRQPYQAIEQFKVLVEMYPKDLYIKTYLAGTYALLKINDKAQRLLKEIKLYTDNAITNQWLLYIYLQEGELNKFSDLIDECEEKYSKAIWLFDMKWKCALINQNFKRAQNLINKSLFVKSSERLRLAYITFLLDNKYQEALEISKNSEFIKDYRYHALLSSYYLAKGQITKAIDLLNKSIITAQERNSFDDEVLLSTLLSYCAYVKGNVHDVFRILNSKTQHSYFLRKDNLVAGRDRDLFLIRGLSIINDKRYLKEKDIILSTLEFFEINRHSKKSGFYKNLIIGGNDRNYSYLESLYKNYPKTFAFNDINALFLKVLLEIYLENGKCQEILYTCARIQGLTFGRVLYGDVYALSFYHQGKIYQKLKEYQKARKSYTQFLKLWGKGDRHIFKQIDDAEAQLKKISSHKKPS